MNQGNALNKTLYKTQQNTLSSTSNPKIFNQNLNETLTQTKLYRKCSRCQTMIEGKSFQLSCLHEYDIECLKEHLKIQINQNQPLNSCLCNEKISQRISKQFLGEEDQDKYFENQLCYIFNIDQKRLQDIKEIESQNIKNIKR